MYSLYFAFPSGEIQPLASFTFFSCSKCILFIHTYLSNLIKRPTLTYFFFHCKEMFSKENVLFVLYTLNKVFALKLLSTTQFIIYVLIDRVADISYVHKVGRLDDFFDEFQNFKKIICGTKTIKSIDYS